MSLHSKTAVILLGGDIVPTARLKRQVSQSDACIIAADGGIRHAEALGVEPHIWLGDFDSKPDAMEVSAFEGEVETHNPDKAQTDGALAIDKALAWGANRLILVGALGGERSDHMLMHMTMALALAAKGLDILMTSGTEEAIPMVADKSSVTITPDWSEGTIFSLIGYSDLTGVTLKGMKWPLHEHSVPFADSLTLSNEITDKAEITLRHGRAIAIAHNFIDTDDTA